MPKTNYPLIGFLTVFLLFICTFSCKKKEAEPPSAPVVASVGVTGITDTSVKAGGKILYDGNSEIFITGFCWSKTNTGPSTADDTSVAVASSGAFVSTLSDLEPGTTYYIRAYAVNDLGTGYGDVLTFNTINAAPKITGLTITGSAIVDSTLTALYTYSDFENDPDSASLIQWYISKDTAGGFDEPIPGATTNVYTIIIVDTAQFIRVGVTPVAASGTSPGIQVKSGWFGPVKQ